MEAYKTASEKFFQDIPYEERSAGTREFVVPEGNEAIIIGSDVNYNALYADMDTAGTEPSGELYVSESIYYDKLLILQLRYNKGAYDVVQAMNQFGIIFSSYRDPQLKDTFEYFDIFGSEIQNMDLTEDELEGYIVSSFVRTAARRGELSDIIHFLVNMVYDTDSIMDTYEGLEQILDTTVEKVKSYSTVYDTIAKNGIKISIGKENDIIANADLFDTITIPFGDDEIYIYVNGKRVRTETAPVVRDDTVLVPVQAISQALGSDSEWNGEQEIIDGQVMAPLNAIAEVFNCSAEWKGDCVVIK
jgi:hypothetical protein